MARMITKRAQVAQRVMALAMEQGLITAAHMVPPNAETKSWGFLVTTPDNAKRFIAMRGSPDDGVGARTLCTIARHCGWTISQLHGVLVPPIAPATSLAIGMPTTASQGPA